MPHVIVEYSANLEAQVTPQRLVEALHRAALDTGVFPLGGLRTRAERRDVFLVADGDPMHAFVAVVARIGAGRDAATRGRIADALMAALEAETAEAAGTRGLALTVEVQEIDDVTLRKANNIQGRVHGGPAR